MGTSRGESVSATQVSDTEPDRPAKSAGNHPEKVKAVGYE
jgi:hypothetical protein